MERPSGTMNGAARLNRDGTGEMKKGALKGTG